VAFRWRIRHKLMLGLGLVVAVIALLLGGTLYGLARFRTTMKSIDSKHAEWREAERFKEAVDALKASVENNSGTPDTLADCRGALQAANVALDAYKGKLVDTLRHGRDPNQGFQETGLVDELRHKLSSVAGAMDKTSKQAIAQPFTATQSLMEGTAMGELMKKLSIDADDLLDEINKDLSQRSKDGRETIRTSLWIVTSTSVLGVVLLVSLLRSFYKWVFYPIHDLEEGAGHVARGDFERRIEVHSGDELEDLAHAFNDMTSRLREMYRDLARQVNERSRQLVRSERLAGVGFLAAGVAHEINNPLASIAFCSEALEGRLANILGQAPQDTEVITKYLKMIQQEAFRCKGITQRLLEFSRGGERHREPTDLVELVQAVLDIVQHLQNCKGKRISVESGEWRVESGEAARASDYQPTPPTLVAWVNAQEIKSVVLNLVVNALESMDEGGRLRIRLEERDGMAELMFADTGCGMTSEVLENIFEPFFTRSRTGKGTGLGLSISHRVINQHGGEIEAASRGPNQGSTFTVRLPLQPAEPIKEESLGHAAA
jgi:two-component system, NtrC family, sensor kinase